MDPRPAADKNKYLAVGASAAVTLAFGLIASIDRNAPYAVAAMFAPPVAVAVICGLLVTERWANLRWTAAAVLVSCLAVAPVMREGVICFVVVLPAALVVCGIVSALVAFVARRMGPSGAAPPLVLLPIGLLAWGATHPPAPRLESLEDEVIVAAPPEAVYASIEHLDLRTFELPAWARWAGLPEPVSIEGRGARAGDVRFIRFSNGALRADVIEADAPRSFRLKLTVIEAGHEFIDHWCRLEDSVFLFEPLPGGLTRVVHRTRYVPRAYPRAYFRQAEELFGHVLQGSLLRAWAARLEAPAKVAER